MIKMNFVRLMQLFLFFTLTVASNCGCVGGDGVGHVCSNPSGRHHTDWCYLKGGLSAKDCPGAVKSSNLDMYWSEKPCEESVCKDHNGTIATIRNDAITCSSLESDFLKKKEKEKFDCNKSLRAFFELNYGSPGPNISPDMTAKDLCPLVYKDKCTTCATGKSNLRGDCKDHEGAIATMNDRGRSYWNISKITCSSIASLHLEEKEKEKKENEKLCNQPMRDWIKKQGAVLGPNIIPDMYARDLCPLVFKDICKTCATGKSDSNSQGNWRRSAASQQASNMCFLAVLLLLGFFI